MKMKEAENDKEDAFNSFVATSSFFNAIQYCDDLPDLLVGGSRLQIQSEMSSPSIFPEHWLWSNFSQGWTAIPKFTFAHFYINTLN